MPAKTALECVIQDASHMRRVNVAEGHTADSFENVKLQVAPFLLHHANAVRLAFRKPRFRVLLHALGSVRNVGRVVGVVPGGDQCVQSSELSSRE
jgi:hypothetical protein